MTDEEKTFRKLCDYVKKDIMGYDDNQQLDKFMIMRLRGLRDGKYIANKVTTSMAHYPYNVILATFIYVKRHGLDDIVRTKKFNSEHHKFNYILVIVSNNINTIYNKMKKIKEEQNRADNIEVVELPNYNNQYDKKSISKNLEKFW